MKLSFDLGNMEALRLTPPLLVPAPAPATDRNVPPIRLRRVLLRRVVLRSLLLAPPCAAGNKRRRLGLN